MPPEPSAPEPATSTSAPRRYVAIGTLLLACVLVAIGAIWYIRASAPPSNIDWYASAERLDPIFAVEGTDPQKLRTAVAALLLQRDDILKGLHGSSTKEVGQALYPDDFLKLLPDLQAARESFLAHPTSKAGQEYHVLLLRTIDAYRTDAQRLADTLRKQAARGEFTFLGGSATWYSQVHGLNQVVTAAGAQKAKEQARYACAQRFDAATCPSVNSLRDARLNATTPPEPLTPPATTTLKADTLQEPLVRYNNPSITALSPFLGVTTTCTTYPITYVRGWVAQWQGGMYSYKFYFANDVFFYDLAKSTEPNTQGLYADAIAQGFHYEYQNMANSYMCPDFGILVSDLMRIEGERELAAASSTTLAQQITLGPFIDLNAAATFAQADGSDDALERYLEGSANFDTVLGGLISDNLYVLRLATNGGWMEAPFYLVARNYASTLFLLGNPTFVPQKVSLYKTVGTSSQDPTLHSWVNELSKTIGQQTLINQAEHTSQLIRFKSTTQQGTSTGERY